MSAPVGHPAAVPLAALDRGLIESIDLSLWKLLFEALGYPVGIGPKTWDLEVIVDALGKATSAPLMEALQTIHDLNSDDARATLLELAEQEAFSTSAWKDDAPLALAVRFVARRPSDSVARRIVELALTVVYERRSPEPVKEFAGNAPKAAVWSKSDVERTRADLTDFFETQGMGSHLELHARGTTAGSAVLVVVHGHRPMATLVIDDRGRRLLEYRPAICDVLRFDADTGRLRIAARSPRLVAKYREVAGKLFCGDREFFLGDDLWTLDPLIAGGREGLEAAVRTAIDVHEIRLVELHWATPTGGTVRAKARELFEELGRLDARLTEATLLEARLSVRIAGPRPNRKTICIRPPNHADIPERFESALLPALTAAGLRKRPGDRDKRNLWALGGGPRHMSEWREAYGAETDQMMKAGLLVPAMAPTTSHVAQPRALGALSVRSVDVDGDDTVLLGVPDDRALPRILTSSDVGGAALDESRFAAALAETLGTGSSAKATRIKGVFALGVLSMGHVQIHPFVVLRAPGVAPKEVVSEIAKYPNAVLLVPVGCSTASGLPEVELERHAPPFDSSILQRLVQALSLGDAVDAIHRAPTGTELVVDCAHRKAWLYGQLLPLDEGQRFRFLELVAFAAFKRQALPSARLSELLSKGPDAHKRAKKELRAAIDALFAGARQIPDLFPSKGPSQGYDVTVRVHVFGEPK